MAALLQPYSFLTAGNSLLEFLDLADLVFLSPLILLFGWGSFLLVSTPFALY